MFSNKLPLAIEIEINSNCNLSCSYCPNSIGERSEKGQMSRETFEHIMQQLKELSYSGRISYHFYNEPTLSPNLELFVELTKKYLPRSQPVLFTNGSKLNAIKIKNLVDLGIEKFMITEHEQLNLKNIAIAKSELPSEINARVKFDSFRDLPFTNRGGLLTNLGKKLDTPFNKPCLIPKCNMVITVKGNVVACYEDYFQKHVMGNIFEAHIGDIWNSEKYINFREDLKNGLRHKYEVCRHCNNSLVIV